MARWHLRSPNVFHYHCFLHEEYQGKHKQTQSIVYTFNTGNKKYIMKRFCKSYQKDIHILSRTTSSWHYMKWAWQVLCVGITDSSVLKIHQLKIHSMHQSKLWSYKKKEKKKRCVLDGATITTCLRLLYTHIINMLIYAYTYICWIHTDAINKDAVTKTQEGRRRKTSLQKYIPLTLLQVFERVVQGLHVRGSWRLNINCNILTPLLWPPRCVFLVLLMLGSTPLGLPRAPLVGCGFPYHIWSLAVWNSTGNRFLDSNSTELNNNSMPTWSPTGSLKSNV